MPPFSPMRSKPWMGKWARESFHSLSKVTALTCKAWNGKDTGWALEPMLPTPLHTPSIPASSSCSPSSCMAGSGHFQEEERETQGPWEGLPLFKQHQVLSPHHKICSVCVWERERERLWTKVTARKVGICQQQCSGGGQPSQLLGKAPSSLSQNSPELTHVPPICSHLCAFKNAPSQAFGAPPTPSTSMPPRAHRCWAACTHCSSLASTGGSAGK